jgi:hypothetical protein
MSRQPIRAGANASLKKKASPSTLYDEGIRHFESGRLAVA